MNVSQRLAPLVLALACGLVSGMAAAQTARIPADAQPFPPDQRPCLQVVGDSAGSAVLADPAADKSWVEIDREVTRSLVAELSKGGYANASVFIEQASRAPKPSPMEPAWRNSKCARVVLISHKLGNIAKGPYFEIGLILEHVLSSESGARTGTPATILFDVAKAYRYGDTPEARQALRPGALGKALFHDLLASGQIEFARTGQMPPPGGQPVGPGFPLPDVQLVQEQPEGATAPPDAKSCLLISTGAIHLSTVSADPTVDKVWVEADRQLMVALQQGLNHDGYRTLYVFTDIAQRDAQPPRVNIGVQNSRCGSLITIAHQVGEDDQGRFFGFNVTVSHFVTPFSAPAGDPPKVALDYVRLYRFPLSQELMDTFRPSDFASSLKSDLEARGMIDFARVGTLPRQDDAPPAVPAGEKPVSAATLRRSYDMFLQRWPDMHAQDVHVRQIVVASEAQARATIDRLQAGEAFEVVAQALTTDTLSRDTGGDIGWSQVGAFPIDLARMVQALEPRGLATSPVRTPAGWVVIEVLGMRPSAPPAFEVLEGKMAAGIRASIAANKH